MQRPLWDGVCSHYTFIAPCVHCGAVCPSVEREIALWVAKAVARLHKCRVPLRPDWSPGDSIHDRRLCQWLEQAVSAADANEDVAAFWAGMYCVHRVRGDILVTLRMLTLVVSDVSCIYNWGQSGVSSACGTMFPNSCPHYIVCNLRSRSVTTTSPVAMYLCVATV